VALHQLGCDSREAECEGRQATVTLGRFKSPLLRQLQVSLHWTVCHVKLTVWHLKSFLFRSVLGSGGPGTCFHLHSKNN